MKRLLTRSAVLGLGSVAFTSSYCAVYDETLLLSSDAGLSSAGRGGTAGGGGSVGSAGKAAAGGSGGTPTLRARNVPRSAGRDGRRW